MKNHQPRRRFFPPGAKKQLRMILMGLSETEAVVLALRWGICRDLRGPHKAASNVLIISRERVERIDAKARERIQDLKRINF